MSAVDILRGCAGDAEKVIPALCELLNKEKITTVRVQCAWALGEICERVNARAAKPAVAPLIETLRLRHGSPRLGGKVSGSYWQTGQKWSTGTEEAA